MSEFEMDFGQELIEIIAKKLISEATDPAGIVDGDSNKNIKAFIRDFADWSDIVLDDSDDSDYVEVENSDTSSSSEEEDPDIPPTIEVNEIYETEVDSNGFHRLKDVSLEEK